MAFSLDYRRLHLNSYTKRRPQGDKASEAKSMCTIVVKAFKNIPAVSVLQASIMHDVNGISINKCLQIITSPSCMQNTQFIIIMLLLCKTGLPRLFQTRTSAPVTLTLTLTHRYLENDNVQTMRKMDDLHLVDFVGVTTQVQRGLYTVYDIALRQSWFG